MKKYDNPIWEPLFPSLSPILSKVYFGTSSGPLRYMISIYMLKKLGRVEKEWAKEVTGRDDIL